MTPSRNDKVIVCGPKCVTVCLQMNVDLNCKGMSKDFSGTGFVVVHTCDSDLQK